MSSTTTATQPPRLVSTPDALQLEVVSDGDDDAPVDQELVLATDELDDEDEDGEDSQHVRQQHKKRGKFSLPRIQLGKKSRYSRVTVEHATAAYKTAQPVAHSTNGSHGSQPSATSPAAAAPAPSSARPPHVPCFTCFNVSLFLTLCLTLFCTGYIGYVIGRKSFSSASHIASSGQKLIVLSIDGFAAPYLTRNRGVLPNLVALLASSLSAVPLTPVYPSLTFPNHYTLVTGLYPTAHGIVSNRMYNRSTGEWFDTGAHLTNASYWWLGEPVWATAQRAGLKSAVLNWPGSDKLIGGVRPTVWAPYNGSLTDAERVQQLMAWLDADACTLCMLYFSSVDSAGHAHGPLSPDMNAALSAMDHTVGLVVIGLTQRGLWNSSNLLVVSDHGMTSVNTSRAPSNDRLVLIDHYTNVTDYLLVYDGPLAHILPTNNATVQRLWEDLQRLPHCAPYWSANNTMPAQLHYAFADSERIPPIVLVCELGIQVMNSTVWESDTLHGAHGYAPTESDMGAIMIAHGAGLSEAARNARLSGTQSVDVYGLMCRLLGVMAADNDGSMSQFRPYLK